MPEHMIEVKNVSKWYGKFNVLKNCSTNISKGEVVVVCGPSGSGKSTFIKTINALEPFQEGQIWVDGVPVHSPKTDLPKFGWSTTARCHCARFDNGSCCYVVR